VKVLECGRDGSCVLSGVGVIYVRAVEGGKEGRKERKVGKLVGVS